MNPPEFVWVVQSDAQRLASIALILIAYSGIVRILRNWIR